MVEPSLYFGPERRNLDSREQVLRRIRSEFSEMPCLGLTRPQSARLFGLTEGVCERVLATLVREGTLWRDHDGRFRIRLSR